MYSEKNIHRLSTKVFSRGRTLTVAVFFLLVPALVFSANRYWSGGGKTWNVGNSNWSSTAGGGAGPCTNATFATNDAAIFEGTAGTVRVSATNNPNSQTFTVGTYTLSGGTLTLSGASINTNANNATISSIIAGTVGLTKTGSGTLTLSGANTYTGTIDVQSGATMLNGGWQNINWSTPNLADLNVDGTFNVWDGNTVQVDALTGSGTVDKTVWFAGVITRGCCSDYRQQPHADKSRR